MGTRSDYHVKTLRSMATEFEKFADITAWYRCVTYFELKYRIPFRWLLILVSMRAIQRNCTISELAAAVFASGDVTEKALKQMKLNGYVDMVKPREFKANLVAKGKTGYSGTTGASWKLSGRGLSTAKKIDQFLNERRDDILRLDHFRDGIRDRKNYLNLQLKLLDYPI